jgi:FlaA1/EpsC-like NDP-sugar epimerase
MSRNEAANLILAAASLNESGTYIQNMGEEVKMLDVVKRIADYLGAKPKLRIIGLQDGEKMNEELYDGPTEATIFNDVSRSRHSIQMGLAKDVFDNTPLNSKEAKDLIEQLTLKYIKKA